MSAFGHFLLSLRSRGNQFCVGHRGFQKSNFEIMVGRNSKRLAVLIPSSVKWLRRGWKLARRAKNMERSTEARGPIAATSVTESISARLNLHINGALVPAIIYLRAHSKCANQPVKKTQPVRKRWRHCRREILRVAYPNPRATNLFWWTISSFWRLSRNPASDSYRANQSRY